MPEFLGAQHLKESYWEHISKQLQVIFFQEVLANVIKIIRSETKQPIKVENSEAVLRSALRSGKIQYLNGVFSGSFNAKISSSLKEIGALFDKRSGVFKLPADKAPSWVLEEAWSYWIRARRAHNMIEQELLSALEKVQASRYDIDSSKMISSVDKGWRESAKKLGVQPQLSEAGKERLRTDYSENLNLYIKKWLKEDILSLRRDVQENAEAGYRFDALITKIQQRNEVSRNKAKFLARQETGLFMAKYREERFKAVGVTQYKWSTSHDARVRPAEGLTPAQRRHAGNHRILDGRIFEYDNPPVVDPSTGRRGNPGSDFRCRCVDIPILP